MDSLAGWLTNKEYIRMTHLYGVLCAVVSTRRHAKAATSLLSRTFNRTLNRSRRPDGKKTAVKKTMPPIESHANHTHI